VPRIMRNVERRGFVRRAFMDAEVALCREDPTRLAGRWAAKEAVLKALGLGIGSVPMVEIEILALESGAPDLRLTGAAAAAARSCGVAGWSVSISHDGQFATAIAVATC